MLRKCNKGEQLKLFRNNNSVLETSTIITQSFIFIITIVSWMVLVVLFNYSSFSTFPTLSSYFSCSVRVSKNYVSSIVKSKQPSSKHLSNSLFVDASTTRTFAFHTPNRHPFQRSSSVTHRHRSDTSTSITMVNNNKSNNNKHDKKLIIHWFRQGDLRLHDNPALVASVNAANNNDGSKQQTTKKLVVGANPTTTATNKDNDESTRHSFLPIVCVDPRVCGGTTKVEAYNDMLKMGPRRAKFWLECIDNLRQNIKNEFNGTGTELLVAYETPETVFEQITKYVKDNNDYSSIEVYCQDEPCSEEKQIVKSVGSVLRTHHNRNIINPIWGTTLYEPNDLPFDGGAMGMNDVFTPFRNKVEKKCIIGKPLPIPTLVMKKQQQSKGADNAGDETLNNLVKHISNDKCSISYLPTLKDLQYTSEQINEANTYNELGVMKFIGGETYALERIKDYIWTKDLLKIYFDTRNGMLGADYSTKLAPWLSTGCISPRYIAEQCHIYEKQRVANKSTYWVVFELLWRDFWKFFCIKHGDSIFYLNGTVGKDARNERTNQKWNNDIKTFDKFINGQTGYPLVDANMKELKATGFMSNRGRQNVASFLALECHLDWRYGATYFEQELLDYDVHSNWGNWCAAAGMTGGRINRFNIVKQSKDYDYDGKYIKHWLPELSNIPSPIIHEPWKMSLDQQKQYNCMLGVNYPNPIVKPFDMNSNSRGGGGGGRGGKNNNNNGRNQNNKSRNHSNKQNKRGGTEPAHWKKGGRKEMKSLPKGEIRMES